MEKGNFPFPFLNIYLNCDENIPDDERAPDDVFPKTIFSNSKFSFGNKYLYNSKVNMF